MSHKLETPQIAMQISYGHNDEQKLGRYEKRLNEHRERITSPPAREEQH